MKIDDTIKDEYEAALKLAREIWIVSDSDGNSNDKYFFEYGFVSGLKYNIDGSLRKINQK